MVRHGVFAEGLNFSQFIDSNYLDFMNVTVRGRTQHFRTVTFDRTQNAVRRFTTCRSGLGYVTLPS
jgi:hypothetical protein